MTKIIRKYKSVYIISPKVFNIGWRHIHITGYPFSVNWRSYVRLRHFRLPAYIAAHRRISRFDARARTLLIKLL